MPDVLRPAEIDPDSEHEPAAEMTAEPAAPEELHFFRTWESDFPEDLAAA